MLEPASRGVSAPGGVCSWGGLLPGGVCSQGGVCSWGVSAPGGCLLLGVCSRGYIPACTEADPPPWTDTRLWKYYLGPTSLRPVKIPRDVHFYFWEIDSQTLFAKRAARVHYNQELNCLLLSSCSYGKTLNPLLVFLFFQSLLLRVLSLHQ